MPENRPIRRSASDGAKNDMQCISPPELNDGQLLAYLDDAADAAVARHLTDCAACRQRARQLARLLGRMTASLYRLDCPASAELGEYQVGVLAQPQMAAIATHLAECPHCRAEVAQLQGYLADLAHPVEPSIVERAKVLVARLLSGGGVSGPALTPALAGLRGGDAPLVYEAGDAQLTLTVEAPEQAPERRTLFGLLIGAELPGARVQLWQATRLAGETTIDAAGNFVLANLDASGYELVISNRELEIHVQDVNLP
jgi:anti-sigma factor RsiW